MKHYGVRNTQTNKFHRVGKVVQFFPDKEAAKEQRRALNGDNVNGTENFNTGWTISAQLIGE